MDKKKVVCMHDYTPKRVALTTPIPVFAGTVGSAKHAPVGSTILNFSGTKVTRPAVLRGIEVPAIQSAVIEVEWRDYGTPEITLAQWEAISQAVLDRNRPLMVCCVGGHGRTGTALAILLSLWNVFPEGADPVEMLREAYCDEAVESLAQLTYVEKITGREVKVGTPPAKTTSFGSSDWTRGYGYKAKATTAAKDAPKELFDKDRLAFQQAGAEHQKALDEQSRKFASVSLPKDDIMGKVRARMRSRIAKKDRCEVETCHHRRAGGSMYCTTHLFNHEED